MSDQIDLIPVDQEELVLGRPLPWDLYDRSGRLLMRKGEVLANHKVRNLLINSWRQRSSDAPEESAVESAAVETAPRRPPRAIARMPAAPRLLKDAQVLVVEDMKLSQKLLTNMLNQHRIFNIETADDGRSAIKKINTGHFDIVFLDIDMPVMDGLTALAEIKALVPDIFTCLVSGSGTLANVLKAKELGVDAFLAKPISGSGIERVLNIYLNS